MPGTAPFADISAVALPGSGKITALPSSTVLVQGKPIYLGPGYVTPHPPTPYPITHSIGFTIPTCFKVLVQGLPPLRWNEKTTCGCTVMSLSTMATVLVGDGTG